MFNKVILAGRITRDPEVQTTQKGTEVVTLRLAVTTRVGSNDESMFINVAVFGKQVEACKRYLSKGSPIIVEGRLRMRQWEDSNGNRRTTYDVVATRVKFLPGNREIANADGDVAETTVTKQNRPAVGVGKTYGKPTTKPQAPQPVDDFDDIDPELEPF